MPSYDNTQLTTNNTSINGLRCVCENVMSVNVSVCACEIVSVHLCILLGNGQNNIKIDSLFDLKFGICFRFYIHVFIYTYVYDMYFSHGSCSDWFNFEF